MSDASYLGKNHPKNLIETKSTFQFHTCNRSILNVHDIILEGTVDEIVGKIARIIHVSEWTLNKVNRLYGTFNRMNLLKGGTHMDLPK